MRAARAYRWHGASYATRTTTPGRALAPPPTASSLPRREPWPITPPRALCHSGSSREEVLVVLHHRAATGGVARRCSRRSAIPRTPRCSALAKRRAASASPAWRVQRAAAALARGALRRAVVVGEQHHARWRRFVSVNKTFHDTLAVSSADAIRARRSIEAGSGPDGRARRRRREHRHREARTAPEASQSSCAMPRRARHLARQPCASASKPWPLEHRRGSHARRRGIGRVLARASLASPPADGPYGTPDGHAVSHARQPRHCAMCVSTLIVPRRERPSSNARINTITAARTVVLILEREIGWTRLQTSSRNSTRIGVTQRSPASGLFLAARIRAVHDARRAHERFSPRCPDVEHAVRIRTCA